MRTILVVTILAFLGCGDGDTETNTVTVGQNEGEINVVVGDADAELGDESESPDVVCARCIGNPSDGITDGECLANAGVSFEDCFGA